MNVKCVDRIGSENKNETILYNGKAGTTFDAQTAREDRSVDDTTIFSIDAKARRRRWRHKRRKEEDGAKCQAVREIIPLSLRRLRGGAFGSPPFASRSRRRTLPVPSSVFRFPIGGRRWRRKRKSFGFDATVRLNIGRRPHPLKTLETTL